MWVSRGAGKHSSPLCRRCARGTDGAKCAICLDSVINPVRAVRVANESWDNESCLHQNCRGCMRAYLKSKIEDGIWNVRCPHEGCCNTFLDVDFRRILNLPDDKPVLEQYRALRKVDFSSNLRMILQFRSSVQNDGGDQSSDTLQARQPADNVTNLPGLGFESWALEQCQACPVCYVIVRKETGCNSIICRCGTSFCYSCGAPQGLAGKGCICTRKDSNTGPMLGRWLILQGEFAL